MGKADYYLPGGWNVLCDRTGCKIKSTDAKQEWNNLMVRKESWEPRHPQDLIRSKPDRQQVENPRSEREDVFLATNEVQPEDL